LKSEELFSLTEEQERIKKKDIRNKTFFITINFKIKPTIYNNFKRRRYAYGLEWNIDFST
jgi:hypothetical protein